MTLSDLLEFPQDSKTELICEARNDKVRFSINNTTTSWMGMDDPFIERIRFDNLNPAFLDEHLTKEIEIKNHLDRGMGHLNSENYFKAIECFDDAIYYDSCYCEAMLYKSFALEAQGHFVKSLRNYKKAVRCNGELKDIEYHKALLKKANSERDGFPKIKRNIYAGDEYFREGEYEKALDSYEKALNNPSKFKDKILAKLLNKKATTLLHLERYGEALDCFSKSLDAGAGDYALFGCGLCEYNLGLEISDGFKRPLKITKEQSLRQVLVLNELGFFKESLTICDELLKNHFRVDDFYRKLVNAKMHAMDELGLDFNEAEYLKD